MLSAAFLEPTAWMGIKGETWKELLALTGDEARLLNSEFEFTHFWESLSASPPDGRLTEALEIVHALGSDEGRDLIRQATRDQNVAFDVPDEVPARELAAHLWMRSQTDMSLAGVLVLARVGVSEAADTRKYQEYLGQRSLSGTLDKSRLREAVLEWSRANKKHEAVEIFAFERGNVMFCEVLRGDPMKRVIELKGGRPGILEFWPAVSDHIRFEPGSGRIAIATRSGRLLDVYKGLLGSMLAGQADFFSDQNVCTLRPLQEQGAQLFEQYRPHEIHRVDVVELHWRRGDRDRVTVRGRDCFKILRDLNVSLVEGELTEAKLRIAFAGPSSDAYVVLKVPNRIDIKGIGIHEEVLRRLLSNAGIRGTAKVAMLPPDTWSLFPYRLTELQWRAKIGQVFDRLVQSKALRAVSLESVTHPDHPGHPGALAVKVLPDGTRIGVSDEPIVPLRTLSATDYLAYEPDWGSHLGDIAVAMGLTGKISEVDGGLWHVGARTFAPSASVCVFVATRSPSAHFKLIVDQHSGGASSFLLIPNDCNFSSPVPTLKVTLPGGPFDGLLKGAVERFKWHQLVSPPIWNNEDLVIETTRGTAWYRGQELTHLKPETQPYKFAVCVAREQGRPVGKRRLNDLLSPGRQDDEAAKTAKSDFKKAVLASFDAAGKPCPAEAKDMFVSRNPGYALVCSARVL